MTTYGNCYYLFIYEFIVNKVKIFCNLLTYVCEQYIVTKYLMLYYLFVLSC